MLLIVSQFSIVLFYVYLTTKGDLGEVYRNAAVEAIKQLRFDIIEELFQQVVSAGTINSKYHSLYVYLR